MVAAVILVIVVALFVFVSARSVRPALGPKPDVIAFDERGVTRRMPNGREESISWADLAEIQILTTSDGPLGEDVFWLLLAADRKRGCCVPGGSEGVGALLERLQQLPGFDNEAVIRAMGSTSEARFCVWQRT